MLNKKITADLAVKQLLSKYGAVDTIEMLEFALPLVVERKESLSESLLSNNLAEASKIAHKTISSIRFYGSSRLEDLLKEVKDVRSQQKALELQPQLIEEFDVVINVLRKWLLQYS